MSEKRIKQIPYGLANEGIKYSYMVEIKYIKKSKPGEPKSLEKKILQLKAKAEAQLKQYVGDEKFKKSISKTTLIKLVVIFWGSELKYIGQAN